MFLGSVAASVALVRGGNAEQQSRWLPKIASGEVVVGLAIAEAVAGARDGMGVTAVDGRLSGGALFVTDATAADLFLVADTAGGLHLVVGDAAGLTRSDVTSIDLTRRLGELAFDGVAAEPLAAHTLDAVRDATWTLLAADTVGASEVMIEKAVTYAKERRQFGRVIGSFQAV